MTRCARYTALNESVVEAECLGRTSANQSFEDGDVSSTLLPRAPEILIVEDDSDLAVGLMNVFEDWEIQNVHGRCKAHIALSIDRARSYLRDDTIDIYVVDLILDEAQPDRRIGAEFIADIVAQTRAGIIVLTSLGEADAKATELLRQGADDYIRKPADLDYVRARLEALWRRIQYVRPSTRGLYTHNNREFLLGNWRFVIGSRILSNSQGETLRLSPTEHAFLRYLCVNENHECDVVTFNIEVLGRKSHEESMRVDNLVYRLRNKLGGNLELLTNDGKYRLLQVSEINSMQHSRTPQRGLAKAQSATSRTQK
jgi:DNA-binding response OmpR family regulator